MITVNKKTVLVLLFTVLLQLSGFSQQKEKAKEGFTWDKVVIGGNFGASFGQYTFVNVSPNVGYYFAKNLIIGVGGTYIYYDEPFYGSSNMFGGRVFSNYFLFEHFVLHAEYEVLNMEVYDFYGFSERKNIGSLLVGGGLRSALGGRSFASIMLLYNLNESVYSPYSNPLLRVGFGIGL